MSLEMIIGCMFARKTTRLIEKIKECRRHGKSILVVTHSSDTRYQHAHVVSHDSQTEPAITCTQLSDIKSRVLDCDVVFIEEAQFFPDLEEFVKYVVTALGKHVYVCGLDGDFRRDPFRQIVNLIPFADRVEKCFALCVECGDGTPAPFTMRLPQKRATFDGDDDTMNQCNDVVQVGGTEMYKPVCRRHFRVCV